MKLISKECPKCGANLKFKVGEHEVHCEKCRRDFVIEYDDDVDLKNIANEISSEGVRLVNSFSGHINENMKMFRTIFIIVFAVVIVAFIGIFVLGIINAQRINSEFDQEWKRANTSIQGNY